MDARKRAELNESGRAKWRERVWKKERERKREESQQWMKESEEEEEEEQEEEGRKEGRKGGWDGVTAKTAQRFSAAARYRSYLWVVDVYE